MVGQRFILFSATQISHYFPLQFIYCSLFSSFLLPSSSQAAEYKCNVCIHHIKSKLDVQKGTSLPAVLISTHVLHNRHYHSNQHFTTIKAFYPKKNPFIQVGKAEPPQQSCEKAMQQASRSISAFGTNLSNPQTEHRMTIAPYFVLLRNL